MFIHVSIYLTMFSLWTSIEREMILWIQSFDPPIQGSLHITSVKPLVLHIIFCSQMASFDPGGTEKKKESEKVINTLFAVLVYEILQKYPYRYLVLIHVKT